MKCHHNIFCFELKCVWITLDSEDWPAHNLFDSNKCRSKGMRMIKDSVKRARLRALYENSHSILLVIHTHRHNSIWFDWFSFHSMAIRITRTFTICSILSCPPYSQYPSYSLFCVQFVQCSISIIFFISFRFSISFGA